MGAFFKRRIICQHKDRDPEEAVAGGREPPGRAGAWEAAVPWALEASASVQSVDTRPLMSGERPALSSNARSAVRT